MCIRDRFRVLSNYNDGYYGSDYGYGNGYYGNDYGYGSSYGYGNDGVFRCESKDGRTAHCNSYGSARLVRQVSDSPVSYTHLDVYKRQVAPLRVRRQAGRADEQEGGGESEGVAHGVIP